MVERERDDRERQGGRGRWETSWGRHGEREMERGVEREIEREITDVCRANTMHATEYTYQHVQLCP